MRPPSLRHPTSWPAPVLNGISVGLGVACVTALIGMVAGMPAAITAASGASTASVADTVCAPQAKRAQMLPAVLTTALVTLLVALTHAHPWALTGVVLLTVFSGIFWMAWGKRGGPQTFVMVLTLVFQMAAFSHLPGTLNAAAIWTHVGWVTLGAAGMAAWSGLSIRVLARRYRTLALAESLSAVAAMMQAQARWTLAHAQGPAPSSALLDLIRQQAGLADVFQNARDLLYSQAQQRLQDPAQAPPILALMHAVNLRDVVQACQLDLDRVGHHADTRPALQALAHELTALADRLTRTARAWQQGQPGASPMPPGSPPHWPDAIGHDPVIGSLYRRSLHMRALVELIDHPARTPDTDPTLAAISPRPSQLAVLDSLVSPTDWHVAALKAQWSPNATVFRYAVRATLAVGCAHAVAHVLPWAAHPHWVLMTVAVVMRGNLEQTLARRDARIQGTLVGCVLASALLTLAPHSAWLMLPLVLAIGIAHGFVWINYRVTAAAGAVLALLQGHLFNPGETPALIDAAERLGDTVIGAGLAWAFSYVLPSWERQQLPRLAARLLMAQGHYAHHALHWHEVHERTPLRSHARREVYDVLWLLAQSLQRMTKEPRHTQSWAPPLETLLVHSHRLISHLAAIKGLLTVRHREMDAASVQAALQQTEQALRQALRGEVPASRPDVLQPDVLEPTPTEHLDSRPLHGADLTAWLQLRLALLVAEAAEVGQAARALRHPA